MLLFGVIIIVVFVVVLWVEVCEYVMLICIVKFIVLIGFIFVVLFMGVFDNIYGKAVLIVLVFLWIGDVCLFF